MNEARTHRLDPLLRPRSIAMVGASNQAGRIGGMPLDLLRHFGYAGRVFPINPKYEEVFGYTCYPDIESVPETPDLVVLAIGAEDVTPMLERCHAKGVPAAIVYAAGFAEAGEAGAALQKPLEAFVTRSGMVVAGPNCMGFANLNLQAHTAFASVFRSAPPQEQPGRVSILTQSGNVCSAVFALVRKLGTPVSQFINTGNEASLEFSEYLEFLAQDPQTDCVIGYVEQLRHGQRFIDAALSFAEQGKPLVIYKAGETEKGSEAVRSHTSALAGDLALYQAGFEQLNVIRGTDFAQMADLAYLSGFRHREGGRRVAIVTMSGALGAILADKLIGAGLDVPTLPQDVQEALRKGIPDYGMVSNPVDVTGNLVNTPEFVRSIFTALAECDAVDTVIVYAPGYLLDRMADTLVDICARHPRLFVAIDTGAAQCRSRLADAGIPVFDDLGRATQALAPYCLWLARRAAVARWAELRKMPPRHDRAPQLPARLNEHDTKALLAQYGVASLPEKVCEDALAAVQAAEEIGYPVALKILSADIAHKTEAGGVRLNIADPASLRTACAEVLEAAHRYDPAARIDGLLVQPMASGGVAELIAGVTHDPVFGPALTVGLGGVLTELYRDTSHRLLPVDTEMVGDMLRSLKAWPLLDGFRGRSTADVAAACASIAALSAASAALGEQAQEIEINPIQVRAHGKGAVALDALVVTRPLA
ncbi:acetate--CoA ligase family protein [Variovorax ginsengisoli]|uniref:Acetate--CoA ligase family protein n=1 Tax=Variovorax ginsengisoli TaxID=363844 RepID=A0ABT8SBE6_9BURK|nr:acetate--CoA ligase family protein [Variovorax ginsengisoli]MDN8616439.1 acetate--CoA ligase family protein [Variovorax ginsengisoli]MDO1535609.1 acetate--CoA ligase family protein [Variovorax ginsengisoli]